MLSAFLGEWNSHSVQNPTLVTVAFPLLKGCPNIHQPFHELFFFKEINTFTRILTSFPDLTLNLTTKIENVTTDSKILMEEFEYQSRHRFTCFEANSCQINYYGIISVIASFGIFVLAFASLLCCSPINRRNFSGDWMFILAYISIPTMFCCFYFGITIDLCVDAESYFEQKLANFSASSSWFYILANFFSDATINFFYQKPVTNQ